MELTFRLVHVIYKAHVEITRGSLISGKVSVQILWPPPPIGVGLQRGSHHVMHLWGFLRQKTGTWILYGSTLKTKVIGQRSGSPTSKFGFPKIFQVFQVETENLYELWNLAKHSESLAQLLAFQDLDFYRLSGWKAMWKNWLSSSVFGCPGKPVNSHPDHIWWQYS